MGSALKDGSKILLYSAVLKGEGSGNAYRFATGDKGETWTAERVSVSGIAAPFKRNIDGQLFVRVGQKGRQVLHVFPEPFVSSLARTER